MRAAAGASRAAHAGALRRGSSPEALWPRSWRFRALGDGLLGRGRALWGALGVHGAGRAAGTDVGGPRGRERRAIAPPSHATAWAQWPDVPWRVWVVGVWSETAPRVSWALVVSI